MESRNQTLKIGNKYSTLLANLYSFIYLSSLLNMISNSVIQLPAKVTWPMENHQDDQHVG